MQYRKFAPSPPLADSGLPTQAIYPDGCAEIVFQYGDYFLRQPRSVFAGQIYKHLKIVPSGRTGTVGFFTQPQSEFTGLL